MFAVVIGSGRNRSYIEIWPENREAIARGIKHWLFERRKDVVVK